MLSKIESEGRLKVRAHVLNIKQMIVPAGKVDADIHANHRLIYATLDRSISKMHHPVYPIWIPNYS